MIRFNAKISNQFAQIGYQSIDDTSTVSMEHFGYRSTLYDANKHLINKWKRINTVEKTVSSTAILGLNSFVSKCSSCNSVLFSHHSRRLKRHCTSRLGIRDKKSILASRLTVAPSIGQSLYFWTQVVI